VYGAVAAFFSWGLSTPDLDRVWTLHHELKSGRIGAPNAKDREVLTRSMAAHPELASALLRDDTEIGLISANMEGWLGSAEATIVRTPTAAASNVQLEIASPDALLPITVELDGPGLKEKRELTTRGLHTIALPKAKGSPELIVLRLRGQAERAEPSVLGVRVSFGDAKALLSHGSAGG
jgi:hypothetical protein